MFDDLHPIFAYYLYNKQAYLIGPDLSQYHMSNEAAPGFTGENPLFRVYVRRFSRLLDKPKRRFKPDYV